MKIIAGPCSAESESQIKEIADSLNAFGVKTFRAGVWKPRTRPNNFEGFGEKAIPWLAYPRNLGMEVTVEVANKHQVSIVLENLHIINSVWIGARTTANPFAVQEIAEALEGSNIPVMVKNPLNPDIQSWVGAIERLQSRGIKNISAVHRGFTDDLETRYRNSPRWDFICKFREALPDIPIVCDPSHIAGSRLYIDEVCRTAAQLGVDTFMIESHSNPENAMTDAAQQVTPEQLHLIVSNLKLETEEHLISLSNSRNQIDAIDRSIVRLLEERFKQVANIKGVKKAKDMEVRQPQRWEDVLRNIKEESIHCTNISESEVVEIFNTLHNISIANQI